MLITFRLTSFVVKSFQEASPYITIGPNKMATAITWILDQQHRDGYFIEPGFTHNSHLKVAPKDNFRFYKPVTSCFLFASAELSHNRDSRIQPPHKGFFLSPCPKIFQNSNQTSGFKKY